MNIHSDYYTDLDLPRDVYQKKIKRKFRELAKKHHPDNSSSSSDVLFKRLKEASDVLSDVNQRLIYDSMQGSNTSESHLPIEVTLTPQHVLMCLPAPITYRRKVECTCEGKDHHCKFCQGSGIMEEDVEMIYKETNMYPNGLTFTVDNAGNIDQYGRVQDAIVKMTYICPPNWEYNNVTHKFLYTHHITFELFQREIEQKGHIEVYINNIGTFKLTKAMAESGNIFETNLPRLKIKLSVVVENIKNYFD